MADPKTSEGDEAALAELVRQAELRLTAQVTVLIGSHQRAVTLTGVLFAVLAALLGVASNYPDDSPIYRATFWAALPLALSVFFCGLSTSLNKINLPGAVHIKCSCKSKSDLMSGALADYIVSYRGNAGRIFISRGILWAGLLCALLAIVSGGHELVEGAKEVRAAEVDFQPADAGLSNERSDSSGTKDSYVSRGCSEAPKPENSVACRDSEGRPVVLQKSETAPD